MASSKVLSDSELDEETKFQRFVPARSTLPPLGGKDKTPGPFDHLVGKAKYMKRLNEIQPQLETLKEELHQEREKRKLLEKRLQALGNAEGEHAINTTCFDKEDDPVSKIESILLQNRQTLDAILRKLTNTENELKKSTVYLEKIHSLVIRRGEEASEELQDIIVLKTDDDSGMITSGFDYLKKHGGDKSFGELSAENKKGIRMLVYKFGSLTCGAFSNILGAKFRFTDASIGDSPLNEDVCTKVISKLIEKKPEITATKFLELVQDIERQQLEDRVLSLREETFAKTRVASPEPRIDQSTDVKSLPLKGASIFGGSKMSVISQKSNYSAADEIISTHGSARLQKMTERPDTRPDMETILYVMHAQQMEHTQMLHNIIEKVCQVEEEEKVQDNDSKEEFV